MHVNPVQLNSHIAQHALIRAANASLVNTLNKNSTKIKLLVFVMTTNTLIKIKIVNYVILIKSVFLAKITTVVQNVTHKNISTQLQLVDNVNVNLVMLSKIMPV